MSQQPAQVTPGSPTPGRSPPITASDRIWTIPNVISFIRLLGVPLFLYLLLGPQHDVAAVIVLALGGTTDWVDGYVARRMNSVSRLGELLDPFADRLYILATLIGFTLREVVPWWLTAALLLREARARRSRCWCCAGTGTGRRRCTTSARPARSCCSARSRCCCWREAVPVGRTPVAGADRLGPGLVGARPVLGGRGALPGADRRAAARRPGQRPGRASAG